MAKNYKRYAQGQRFQSKNFGDMGLRAYREQQQTIINAMKLQAQQHKQVRDQYLKSDIDKSRKERENRAELKKLEDAVYENKYLNTQIRADREIEALKEQAKEHEKSSKFWQDFSSTYAKQYKEAFDQITGAIDLKYAEKIFDKQKNEGLYDKIISNSETLNNISSAGIINETDKIYADKNNSGHYKRTEHAHALDIEKRRSTSYNDITSAQLIEDSDKIITHLVDTLQRTDPKNPNKGIRITKDNIRGLIQGRALEIMGNLGMDPNSKGGKKFLDHMWKVAGNEAFKRQKLSWAKEDDENLYGNEGLLARLKSSKDDTNKWEDNFNHTIKLYQYRYVSDDKGNVSLQEMNVKEAYSAVQNLLIDEGVITRLELNNLNIPFPGQARDPKASEDPTKDTRELMWKRHPDLEQEALSSLLQKEKKDAENKLLKETTDDKVALTKLQVDMESGKVDPNNIDQVNSLEQANHKNKDTLEFIQKIKVFNPTHNDIDGFLVNERINKAYNNNDYNDYKTALQYLGKEDRQRFNEFTKRLDDLNRNGGSHKEISTEFEKHVKADLKLNSLNDAEDPTVSSVIDIMQQDFYFQERKFHAKGLRGAELVDTAIMEVKAKYDKGKGLYLKIGEGNSTVFSAMKGKYDPSKAITREQLDKKLNEGGGDWNNLFKKVEESQKSESPIHILDQDWVERNLRNIINGKSIESNETIDYLYYSQPNKGAYFSKTEILNKYLAAKGIETQVPKGALDKADRDVIENARVNIDNYRKMSDANKMRVQVYLQTLDPNDLKQPIPRDVHVLERNDKVRQNFLGGPQYSMNEVKSMNKSNKPWWYNPALFGDAYNKNK